MTAVNPLSSHFRWSEDRKEKLKELRASGLSSSQIVDRFFELYHIKLTRNAILGKCDRMGLETPLRRSNRQRNGETYNQRQRRWPSVKNRTRSAKKIFPNGLKNLRESIEVEFEGNEACDLPADQSPHAVTFAELHEHSCRWPLPDKRYCGAARLERLNKWGFRQLLPYCARHCRVAYRS